MTTVTGEFQELWLCCCKGQNTKGTILKHLGPWDEVVDSHVISWFYRKSFCLDLSVTWDTKCIQPSSILNIECSGKFDSPAPHKGSTCWSMLAVNCIAWWCCSSNMSMCKSSRKSFLSSSIHPSSSCVEREGKNKPIVVKRMKTDINYGFSLWTVVGKSQEIPSCDSAAVSWEGACPCAKCGYWPCYLLPQLPPSPAAGFYLQQPSTDEKTQPFDPWKYLKGLGQFWFVHNLIRMYKTLQIPKLENTSCEAASNSRRKILLGVCRTFLLPFPIIPTGKTRNIQAKRTVMVLTPCLQEHWQGLLSQHREQRQIKQWCSRLFVQHLCCANPCSTKGSASTFYYSWGGFLTVFKYFKRRCMKG